MLKATNKHKPVVVEILFESFYSNRSIQYIIPKDNYEKRARHLMEYSYDMCKWFGDVFLSDDEKACALILYPEKKKFSLFSLILDLKLLFNCIGFKNINRVLKREAAIKKIHPATQMSYLWYIGVSPSNQHKGIGSGLLKEIINKSNIEQRLIYLETSLPENIAWYQKHGFDIYHQLDFGYNLYFLRNNI